MEYQGSFDFFYGQESERLNFITIPKLLLKDKRFRDISSEAKLLYGCLLDRNSLSQKNGWVDSHNRVYVIYTIKEMQDDLCCATEKISKVLRELETIGLIYRKRNGRGKANYIYVMDYMAIYRKERYPEFEHKENGHPESGLPLDKNFDKRKSRLSKNENQEFRKSKCNKTDLNKTEDSKGSRHPPYRNPFCNFPQNDYDFEELERVLLAKPPPGE